MSFIRWGQATKSGLCDRLEDMILMAAYARVKKSTLLIDWPIFEAKDIDVAHRSQDILLENIQKFMTFPDGIAFNKDPIEDEHFPHYLGCEVSADKFHSVNLQSSGLCSPNEFRSVMSQVASEFKFNRDIQEFLDGLPKRFIAFHVRRGDKVRLATNHDGTFILKHELSNLDRLTFRAMEYFADDFRDAFICGDEDDKLKPFFGLADDLNLNIIRIPEMPKWESTFYDLAVMTKSHFNICSQRYSSFSHFPSAIGKGLFITVYQLQDQGKL